MGLSTENQSCSVPPGFRFHPTEEELVYYYLRKKISHEMIDLDVIRDVDLNKLEPWDLHERCKIGSAQQNEWYFFSHKDKKYPTGSRTNRATSAGFWKATGRDKPIYMNLKRIGMRKTLVFYTGRAPRGQKTEWIMHEYRLEDNENPRGSEEGWVVCRAFKKRMHHKDINVESQRSTHEQQITVPPRLGFPDQQQLNLISKQSQLIKFSSTFSRDYQFMQMPQLHESPEGSTYNPSTWTIRQSIPERLLENSSTIQPLNHMRELQADQPEMKLSGIHNGLREEWTVLDSFFMNQHAESELRKHQARVYDGLPQTLDVSSNTSNITNNDYSGSEIDYWSYGR